MDSFADSERELADLFEVVSLDDLKSAHLDKPIFLLQTLVPFRHVSLLSAHGGVGKSSLSLVWAAHAAAGKTWAGLPMERCRVLFVSFEDEGRLIKSRLNKIVDVYELDEALVRENLKVLDGSSGSTALAIEGFRGRIEPTDAMKVLRKHARGRRLIVIDNASNAFQADENDRRQVSTFMRYLVGFARENDAAVLLLAHVSKGSLGRGQSDSYSGSTAWHNVARSRFDLITRGKRFVELRPQKLNIGPLAAPIGLERREGVLVPQVGYLPYQQERELRDNTELVLEELIALTRQGVHVPTAKSGSGNVGLTLEPGLKKRKVRCGRRAVHEALEELESLGKIRREYFMDKQRHRRERWIPVFE